MTTSHCPYCNGALILLGGIAHHASTLSQHCAPEATHVVNDRIDADDV
jgi:hypothetical protein